MNKQTQQHKQKKETVSVAKQQEKNKNTTFPIHIDLTKQSVYSIEFLYFVAFFFG